MMGGIMSKDYERVLKVATRLECGGVDINGSGYRPPIIFKKAHRKLVANAVYTLKNRVRYSPWRYL